MRRDLNDFKVEVQKDLREFKEEVFSRLSKITDCLVHLSSQMAHSFEGLNEMNKKKTTSSEHGVHPSNGGNGTDNVGVPPSNGDNGTNNNGANIPDNAAASSSVVKESIKVIMRFFSIVLSVYNPC